MFRLAGRVADYGISGVLLATALSGLVLLVDQALFPLLVFFDASDRLAQAEIVVVAYYVMLAAWGLAAAAAARPIERAARARAWFVPVFAWLPGLVVLLGYHWLDVRYTESGQLLLVVVGLGALVASAVHVWRDRREQVARLAHRIVTADVLADCSAAASTIVISLGVLFLHDCVRFYLDADVTWREPGFWRVLAVSVFGYDLVACALIAISWPVFQLVPPVYRERALLGFGRVILSALLVVTLAAFFSIERMTRWPLRWPVFLVAALLAIVVAVPASAWIRALIRRLWQSPRCGILLWLGSLAVATLAHAVNSTVFPGSYHLFHLAALIWCVLAPAYLGFGVLRPCCLATASRVGRSLGTRGVAALYLLPIAIALAVAVATNGRLSTPRAYLTQALSPGEKVQLLQHSPLSQQLYFMLFALDTSQRRWILKNGVLGAVFNGNPRDPLSRDIVASTHRRGYQEDALRLPPRLLFISIDALRYDAFEQQTRPGGLMPNLSAVARDAVVFRRAYAVYPRTAQAMRGLFTAVHPYLIPLLDTAPGSLPAQLQAAATPLLLCGPPGIAAQAGLDPGAGQSVRERSDDTADVENVRDTIAFIKSRADPDLPFFAFVHLMAPHADVSRKLRGGRDVLERDYLNSLKIADDEVAPLLQTFFDLGFAANSVLVISADHGETIGGGHNWTVAEEQTHIPLVWRLPDPHGRHLTVDIPVSTLDIGYTIAQLMQVPPALHSEGRSLLPLFAGRSIDRRPIVLLSTTEFGVMDDLWFYIWNYDDGRERLLHRGRVDAVAAEPAAWDQAATAQAATMRRHLKAWLAAQLMIAHDK